MPAVHLERENKTVKVKGLRVKEILKELKINPTTVIITRNNELITDDAELSNKEKIKILPVISGGQDGRWINAMQDMQGKAGNAATKQQHKVMQILLRQIL